MREWERVLSAHRQLQTKHYFVMKQKCIFFSFESEVARAIRVRLYSIALTNTQADNACKFKVGQPRFRQYILSSAISSGINRFDLIASGQTALKQLESLTRKPAIYTSDEAGSSRLRTELVDFTSGVKGQTCDMSNHHKRIKSLDSKTKSSIKLSFIFLTNVI